MSDGSQKSESQQNDLQHASEGSGFLAEAIKATKQTAPDHAKALLATFTEQALQGTVKFDKNLSNSINKAIAGIDAMVSKQLAAVMHHKDFQKLEGSWRGLHYLVQNTETGTEMKLRVLNCRKKELQKDLESATEFDQSQFYKKIYENEFGMAGGIPYGAMVGDYEFTNHPDDIAMLRNISSVAAAAFCPFLTSASCELFGFDNWTDLNRPRDLKKIFDPTVDKKYIAWDSFRETEDSRFVVLTMPRTLARLPYGKNTKPLSEFDFEEVELGRDGRPKEISHDEYCWMSTAYVMGARLTDAFAQSGWCTAIRGAENGGKVENLPTHVVKTAAGDEEQKCPTEVQITDRREKELSDCGFLPLVHYKDKDYSVFFGGQTAQKPKVFTGKGADSANSNAQISARLPYIMATSRIAHYLKVMARDWIGSFKERDDLQQRLNNWISDYICTAKNPSEKEKAERPLAEASIEVTEIPGQPGSYNAVAHLRPWLQMEELNASLRMVAKLDGKNG
jgi:type VI secretion system protein ImpC